MSSNRPFVLSLQCFLFFALFVLFTTSDAREWKVNTTIDGELESISEDGTKVSIRRANGKVIHVPLADLSKEDQAFIEQQNKTSNSTNEQATSESEDQIDFTSPDLKAGDRVVKIINGVEFAFRWCPPGTFMMGSPTSEEGREPYGKGYETQHQVTLTQGFWMMETEVTVGMFKAFIDETGYVSGGNTPVGWTGEETDKNIKFSWKNTGYEQTDLHPVTCVSWDDIEAFYRWLRKKIGMKCTLPTEAQWEYACRAGSTDAYAGDIDEMAWYNYNSGRKPHPVGTKCANAWGLYDMHGNVYERVLDCFGSFSSNAVTDPIQTNLFQANVNYFVIRGGSYGASPRRVRSAFRAAGENDDRYCYIGFRLIIVSENSASTDNVAVPNPIEQENSTAQNEPEQTVKKIDNVSNNQTNENRDYQVVPQEDAETQFKRGLSYYNGDGVPKDYVEAVKWFRKAGDRRHANALYYLGRCYDGGEGVPQSTAEAVKYWQQSASQGNADAQYMLGFCYIMGMGIQQNVLEGFDWVRKAAAQGHQDAQNLLRNSGL